MNHKVNKVSRRQFVKAVGGASAGLAMASLFNNPAQAQEDTSDQEYVIIGALLGIPFWEEPIVGMERVAERLGITVTFIGPPEWDAAQQVSQIEQVLLRQPAGIAILPVDPGSISGVVSQALEMNIPVVTVNTDAPDSGRLSYIGSDRYVAGAQAADAMVEAIGTSGTVGVSMLGGSQALETSLQGFTDRLAEIAPDIVIDPVVDTGANAQRINDGVLQMLQGNPDLAGIFANDTESATVVPGAVASAGRAGEVVVVGNGTTLLSRQAMEAVADGSMYATVTYREFQSFYYCIQVLYDLHNGNTTSFDLTWEGSGISPIPPRVDTGTFVVKQDQVEQILAISAE